jgi:hypothetical protein
MTNLLARSSATGGASSLVNAIADASSTIAGPYNTDNPTGGVVTGTTSAGASHNHAFTGSATSVVQPYIVVYMWKRTA